MSCGVGCRHSSDPTLLCLWCSPVATAPIKPLAWEPPYPKGAAQEMAKKKTKKNPKPGMPKKQREKNKKRKKKKKKKKKRYRTPEDKEEATSRGRRSDYMI